MSFIIQTRNKNVILIGGAIKPATFDQCVNEIGNQ